MLEVVAIGEGQLRLVTSRGTPFERASELRVVVSGTEGNVLGLMARLGRQVGLITAFPNNLLSHIVINEYKLAGIDLSRVVWREDARLALYFMEIGTKPTPSKVIFDRSGSAFSQLSVQDVDWQYVQTAPLIHLSGITAAVSDNAYALVREAIMRAKAVEHAVSFDVNYRSRLWAPEDASRRLSPLMNSVSVLFCPRRDAQIVFGLNEAPRDLPMALADKFLVDTVVVSDGPRPAHAVSGGERLSITPPETLIVDRVGAGDALVGGFLHGYLANDPEWGLRLGCAAATLALTRQNDQLVTSLEELTTMADDSAERHDIQR